MVRAMVENCITRFCVVTRVEQLFARGIYLAISVIKRILTSLN